MALCRSLRAASPALPILLSAALLLWPAVWNGYPLVFDDTGTYLSQAVQHYLGWDRPPFYSLFLLPLHLTITTWPAVAVQAILSAIALHLVRRILLPGVTSWWLLPLTAFLAVATALPWVASQLMPDVFTALLVLALALLVLAPDCLSCREQGGLVLASAWMIAAQQSSLLLGFVLLAVLTPLRGSLGAVPVTHRARFLALLAAAPALAATALLGVNLLGFHRLALSPFGSVFILARVIYDGPGMDVLRRDCPAAGWRLCPYLDRFPGSSDQFLWRPDSPVVLAGGHKRIAGEAVAIIAAALRAEPGTELRAWWRNGLTQLARFDSGDELHACPTTVTPWIRRDFPPAEQARYAAARQTNGRLFVPRALQALHRFTAVAGVAGCAAVLLAGLRRRHRAAGFAAALLIALAANGFIAGGLSTPHDRYGSRVMLLAPALALLGGAALLRRRQAVAPADRGNAGGIRPA